jgi:hypothetical protein
LLFGLDSPGAVPRSSSFGAVKAEQMSLRCGKEVKAMKYFKITRTWVVKVADEAGEQDALKLIADNPDEYLDSETVTRTEYKRKQPQTGWGHAVKDQVFGT